MLDADPPLRPAHRLLAAFAALDASGRASETSCDAVGLALRLRALLGPHAGRFEGCSCAELAVLWLREGQALRGRELLALLWVVSRRHMIAYAPLEARLARAVESRCLQLLAVETPVAPVGQP